VVRAPTQDPDYYVEQMQQVDCAAAQPLIELLHSFICGGLLYDYGLRLRDLIELATSELLIRCGDMIRQREKNTGKRIPSSLNSIIYCCI
jgi:hypothetical protein